VAGGTRYSTGNCYALYFNERFFPSSPSPFNSRVPCSVNRNVYRCPKPVLCSEF